MGVDGLFHDGYGLSNSALAGPLGLRKGTFVSFSACFHWPKGSRQPTLLGLTLPSICRERKFCRGETNRYRVGPCQLERLSAKRFRGLLAAVGCCLPASSTTL
jgi:hypothetical protein